MDFCNVCGSSLIKGVCPHCGQVVNDAGQKQENAYQCCVKAAECLKNRQWSDAEIWVQKGYMQDPSNKELRVAEVLALTEMLRVVPSSANEDARVRELLKDMDKNVKFRYVTYDLEAYRRLIHSHDLSNTTLSWWEVLIGLVIALCLVGALIMLICWLICKPLIMGLTVLVIFIGWMLIST